jgi:1-deoxy-D-xylulose-5-phosphate synthase
MRFAKPIDVKLLQKLKKNHEIFVTIEENAIGGFSSQVNDFLINKLNILMID